MVYLISFLEIFVLVVVLLFFMVFVGCVLNGYSFVIIEVKDGGSWWVESKNEINKVVIFLFIFLFILMVFIVLIISIGKFIRFLILRFLVIKKFGKSCFYLGGFYRK